MSEIISRSLEEYIISVPQSLGLLKVIINNWKTQQATGYWLDVGGSITKLCEDFSLPTTSRRVVGSNQAPLRELFPRESEVHH